MAITRINHSMKFIAIPSQHLFLLMISCSPSRAGASATPDGAKCFFLQQMDQHWREKQCSESPDAARFQTAAVR